MDAIITALGEALRAAATWELNGLLALAVHRLGALSRADDSRCVCRVALADAAGGGRQPAVKFWGKRPWVLGVGVLTPLAAFRAGSPAPMLLAVMTMAGSAAVAFDRFNPDGLRWRVAGGLALYGLASLA